MYYILRQFWTLFCDFKDIVWDGKQNMPSNIQNYIKKNLIQVVLLLNYILINVFIVHYFKNTLALTGEGGGKYNQKSFRSLPVRWNRRSSADFFLTSNSIQA